MPILVDASSPAVASGTTTTTSTGSFSPPGNCLMVAFCQSDANDSSLDEQDTVSGTGQTWTLLKRHNGADNAIGSTVEIWAAWLDAAPGSITVDLTSNKGAVAKRLFVRVFTGAAGTGATAGAGGNSVSYTSTVGDSLGWSVGLGNNTTAIAGAGQSIKDSATGFDGGDGVFTCAQDASTPVVGTTVTMSVSSIVSVHHVAVELVPPPVSVAWPPLPPWLLEEILTAHATLYGGDTGVTGTPPTVETGSGTAVVTATGQAVKVASQTGQASVAATAAGTARKTALSSGVTTSPVTAAGKATKRAADTGRAAVAATAAATAGKTAADTGRAVAAPTAAGTATSSLPRPQTGTTTVPARSSSTARKTATAAGTATSPVRCTATAAKTTTAAGTGRAVACTAGTALRRAALTGRAVAVATASARLSPAFIAALVGLDGATSVGGTDSAGAATGATDGRTGSSGHDSTLTAAGSGDGTTTATGLW